MLGDDPLLLQWQYPQKQMMGLHNLMVLRSAASDEEAPSPATGDKPLTRKERTREAVSKLLKDLEDDDDEPSTKKTKKNAVAEARKLATKVKLEPETVFFEGAPSWTEMLLPTVSILTVIGESCGSMSFAAVGLVSTVTSICCDMATLMISFTPFPPGIIPFAASVARQIWVGKDDSIIAGRNVRFADTDITISYLLRQVRYKITSRRISVTSGTGGKDLTEVIYPDIARMAFVFR